MKGAVADPGLPRVCAKPARGVPTYYLAKYLPKTSLGYVNAGGEMFQYF